MSDLDNDLNPYTTKPARRGMGSRLGNLDSATAFAMAYRWNPGAEAVLARREEFFAYANLCGFRHRRLR